MITDGASHPLSYFDEDFYRERTVTADTYAAEVVAGLYSGSFSVHIKDGYKKIKFRYYNTDDTLIEMDSCPVMYDGEKGEDGAKGEKGYSYRGVFASSADVADPVESDYYLNSGDGYIYQYQDTAGTLTWNQVQIADGPELYNQALADGMATFAGSEAVPIMTAVTTWCKNLVAMSAFIENLFATKIVVSGSIQSSDWTGDNSAAGFYMDKNRLQCVNGLFKGEIESGPLLLRASDPISNITIASGTKVYDAYIYLESKGVLPGATNTVSGTFNGVTVGTFSMNEGNYSRSYGESGRYKADDTYAEIKIDGKIRDVYYDAYRRTITDSKPITINYGNNSISCYYYLYYIQRQYKRWWLDEDGYLHDYGTTDWEDLSSDPSGSGTSSETLSGETNISFSAGKKTFKLTNLPNAASATAGIVYQDNQGYLRISL